ncbi:MAG: glycosyltransferase [Candidatus Adiutrix sp.]
MGLAESKITLGLAMIMKNEAINLPKSLGPVNRLFDEIVVVDTGSTDESRKIAQNFGAQVLDFSWTHDFSAARNFGLRAATTDFIMWLDADNSIGPEAVAEIRENLEKQRNIILWATEVVVPQGDRLWQKRVFPKNPAVSFKGSIHEQLEHPLSWESRFTKVEIHHWGYAAADSSRQKGQRNLALLLAAPETNRGDFYFLYQTGRTLFNLRKFEEAITWLNRTIQAKSDNLSLLGHSLILLSQAQKNLGQHHQAEMSLRYLLKLMADYGPGHYHLGIFLYDSEKFEEAIEHLESALLLGTGDKAWGANKTLCDFKAAFLLGRIWAQKGQGQPARQAFSLAATIAPQNPEPLFALAQAALGAGDLSEAKSHLNRVLQLAPKHRRAHELYQHIETRV